MAARPSRNAPPRERTARGVEAVVRTGYARRRFSSRAVLVRATASIAALAFGAATCAAGSAATGREIAFVPLDDRPVTYQLPVMLGAIAGQRVITPSRALLGHYLRPGDPAGILRWLQSAQTQNVSAIVASTDMLAYGGLVAARAPGPSAVDAFVRLR